MKTYNATHMIRYEDLNHHANLYAGRASEWMIEASFAAVTIVFGNGDGLRYKNTHKFDFRKSVYPGDIITFAAKVVRMGKTSITVHVELIDEKTEESKAESFVTYVTVDNEGRPVRHELSLDETHDQKEKEWRKEAESFFRKP